MAKENLILSKSFQVDSTLITSIESIKGDMGELKGARLLSDGITLKYEITGLNHRSDCLLELSEKSICLTSLSENNDLNIYRDNLAAFFSLVAFLKEHYEVRLADIYYHITNVLGNNWPGISKDQTQVIEGLKERVRSLDESNRTLAYSLVDYSKRNINASRELSIYVRFSKHIVEQLRAKMQNKSGGGRDILLALGIDQELMKRVEVSLKIESG